MGYRVPGGLRAEALRWSSRVVLSRDPLVSAVKAYTVLYVLRISHPHLNSSAGRRIAISFPRAVLVIHHVSP